MEWWHSSVYIWHISGSLVSLWLNVHYAGGIGRKSAFKVVTLMFGRMVESILFTYLSGHNVHWLRLAKEIKPMVY